MAELQFGPIDVYAVGFPGAELDDRVLAAIGALVDKGEVRLLDLLVVRKDEDGAVTAVEFEELAGKLEVDVVELAGAGLVGDEDVDALAAELPPGSSGAILAIELLWAKQLASEFVESGGVVLAYDRVPAEVVNEVFADAVDD
ncbi:DUF6325 family protein [Agromyces seonyuensis]|uniref:DUF1269 domain-containing protein n=1 Tax=Agromyces seonyuensis TaxID=2662446 RepID=A0A6I4P5Q7_9MICO|nr:DUF6325 family protein [Agromyces seonyuensis]MWC00416.1 hypothetical protein [Agromyces seonyuensis]